MFRLSYPGSQKLEEEGSLFWNQFTF
jgi:hypothetical protein